MESHLTTAEELYYWSRWAHWAGYDSTHGTTYAKDWQWVFQWPQR